MGEAALSQSEIYSARPVVRVDEQELVKISELVMSFNMKEQEGGMSSLEMHLSNIASNPQGSADFAFEDEEDIHLGSSIKLYSGDETSPQEIFSGVVTGFEADFPADAPPELVILAEDKLQMARMTRRTAIYNDTSIAGLARTIATRLGLTPTITGFTSTIGNWVQLNESDLAFLRRVITRYDGDMQVVGRELQVSPRNDVQRGVVELELYSQLRSVKFIADLSQQVTDVTVSGWNATNGQRVSATSHGVNTGPGYGRSGTSLLRDAMGERSEHIGHIAVNDNDEAQTLADAVFDQRARSFVCAHGTAVGNPELRVGTHVNITGVSGRFENTYYIVSAHHRFDMHRGYETDFKAECYSLGET